MKDGPGEALAHEQARQSNRSCRGHVGRRGVEVLERRQGTGTAPAGWSKISGTWPFGAVIGAYGRDLGR